MSDDTRRVPDFEDVVVDPVADEPVVEAQPEPLTPRRPVAPVRREPQVVASKCPVCGCKAKADRAGDCVLCKNCSQEVELQPITE